MSSVEMTDEQSQAVQKTPHRVSLASIKAKIADIQYIYPRTTSHMTIAVVTMSNGFVVLGKSAPADPGNYDVKMGKQFAQEDAIRQLWQLEGYLLREKLTNGQ